MFNVLTPIYKSAGFDRDGTELFHVRWKKVGEVQAKNESAALQSAKKITKYPVLEEVKNM